MYHHTPSGECFKATTDTEVNNPNQHLEYGEQTYIACSVGLNLAELQAYCEGTESRDYEIFKQFYDRFNWISIFGQTSQYFKKDWVKVLFPDQQTKAGVWDEATRTCTGMVGLNVKIVTSNIGFESQLQPYVLGAQVKEISDSWAFLSSDPEEKHYFQHIVTIDFGEIQSSEQQDAVRNEGSFFVPKLPDELFYPLNL